MFDAKSSKGSFAWLSILKARTVIEKGMLWRIGDGKQVHLFHDNWIPGKFPTKAVPCRLDALNDSTVSTMMDLDLRE